MFSSHVVNRVISIHLSFTLHTNRMITSCCFMKSSTYSIVLFRFVGLEGVYCRNGDRFPSIPTPCSGLFHAIQLYYRSRGPSAHLSADLTHWHHITVSVRDRTRVFFRPFSVGNYHVGEIELYITEYIVRKCIFYLERHRCFDINYNLVMVAIEMITHHAAWHARHLQPENRSWSSPIKVFDFWF